MGQPMSKYFEETMGRPISEYVTEAHGRFFGGFSATGLGTYVREARAVLLGGFSGTGLRRLPTDAHAFLARLEDQSKFVAGHVAEALTQVQGQSKLVAARIVDVLGVDPRRGAAMIAGSAALGVGLLILLFGRQRKGTTGLAPGMYRILEDETVVTAGPSTESAEIGELAEGAVVQVLEVRSLPAEHRVRGRISEPRGWISILDTDEGFRWASSATSARKPTFDTSEVDRYIRSGVSSSLALRCSERLPTTSLPVRMVIFDLEETLTMATFTRKEGVRHADASDKDCARLLDVNFNSPWVPQRLEKLRHALDRVSKGLSFEDDDDEGDVAPLPKTLAVLSRNAAGAESVLELLKLAKLDSFFSCIWTMPPSHSVPNGVYSRQCEWVTFEPPLCEVADHKANVLHHICQVPQRYFPQMGMKGWADGVDNVYGMAAISPEQVVLADCDRHSCLSEIGGAQLSRHALVARYDAEIPGEGTLLGMGGIGAHLSEDFTNLCNFCRTPWEFPDVPKLVCWQSDLGNSKLHCPLSLIAFDFDETLSLATFLPQDRRARTEIGWKPAEGEGWQEEDLVKYNFESPFVEGSRVAKLKAMLDAMSCGDGDQRRALVVMVKSERLQSEGGAVLVLNLLKLAGLDQFFSAIWRLPAKEDETAMRANAIASKYLERRRGRSHDLMPDPNGLFRDAISGEWSAFETPLDVPKGGLHAPVRPDKALVLRSVVANPKAWFPQLRAASRLASARSFDCLLKLGPEKICLVDNERQAFRGPPGQRLPTDVLRCALVATYDASYRDYGPLFELGGIGAWSDDDYEMLLQFTEKPWEFPKETHRASRGREQSRSLRQARGLVRAPASLSSKARDVSGFDRLKSPRPRQLPQARTPRPSSTASVESAAPPSSAPSSPAASFTSELRGLGAPAVVALQGTAESAAIHADGSEFVNTSRSLKF